VLLPVVLVYQGWTYHVFRGRLGGPPVSGDESGAVVPVPRRAEAAEDVPAAGVPTAPGEGPSRPPVGSGPGDGSTRRGATGGVTPAGPVGLGGLASLAALLVLGFVVSRAHPR
jgi:hypothetical protein